MALIEESSENVAEIRYRFGADKGTWVTTSLDTYSNIIQVKEYSGTTLLVQKDFYYTSFKLLTSTEAAGNWAETGDGAVSVENNAWLDGSTEVLRNTYTYSTGSSIIADSTTNIGDVSDWVGSDCDEGYVTVWLRFSDYSNVTGVTLRIGSSSSDYRSVTVYSGESYNSYVANNVWFPIVFDLSTGSDTGTPDGSAVDYLALVFTIASGTDETVDISCFYAAKESTTVVAGETFYEIGRVTSAWQSEGVTNESNYGYDADENSYVIVRSVGY